MHVKRLATKLIRGVDAHHLESLIVPVHILFANYGHTLSTAVQGVHDGMEVEAKYLNSHRYHKATIIEAHDDGTASVRYAKADQDDQPNVPIKQIRVPSLDAYAQVAEQCTTVVNASQCCHRCLLRKRTAAQCVFACAECSRSGVVCDACKELGYTQTVPELRPCTECLAAGNCDCTRLRPYIIVSDKEAKNKKALEFIVAQLEHLFSRLGGPMWIVFGIQHAVKGARGPLINWYLEVLGDIVGITDLLALFTMPVQLEIITRLKEIIRKEVLVYKDRHNFEHIAMLFGKAVTDLLWDVTVKTTIYPELYVKWRALYKKIPQDLLYSPAYVAFHEANTLIITNKDTVVTGRLSNPVEMVSKFGQRGKRHVVPTPGRCSASSSRFVDLGGVDFLARQVAIVADTGTNQLRVLHLDDDNAAFLLYTSALSRPRGLAVMSRLDACPEAELPVTTPGRKLTARVAVTELGQSHVVLLDVTQRKSHPPYSATKIIVVVFDGAPQTLSLLGICALPVGRIHISVLRKQRDDGTLTAAQFQQKSKATSDVFVLRSGYRGTDGQHMPPAVLRIGVDTFVATSNGNERRCQPTVIYKIKELDPFDIAVNATGSLFISSKSSTKLLTVEPRNDNWAGSMIGSGAAEVTDKPIDGVASSSSFGGTSGIACHLSGRTIFVIDARSKSLVKVANMDGFCRWATEWRRAYLAFGERDPTNQRPDQSAQAWGDVLADLEDSAAQLNTIAQARLDSIGSSHMDGSELGLSTTSLKAHTKQTVKSMREVYEHVKRLSEVVASQMDPRSATEAVCEHWWAIIRVLAPDSSFDLLMYYTLVPKAIAEDLKRMMGCGFIYNTTDRVVDKTSYSFAATLVDGAVEEQFGYPRAFGMPHWRPPLVMEKIDKKTTGRIIENSDGVWASVGNARRVLRRCDVRNLASAVRKHRKSDPLDPFVISDKHLALARRGMLRLRKLLARMREQMLRTRMRQTVAVAYCNVEREMQEITDEIKCLESMRTEQESLIGTSLPVLRVGDILLERRIDEDEASDADDQRPLVRFADEPTIPDGGAREKGWALMRVVEDVMPTNRTLSAVDGVATTVRGTECAAAFAFSGGVLHERKNVDLARFFATPKENHLSGLYVVQPSSLAHSSEDSATVACFSEDQVREFGRVSLCDRERPDWQFEWWEPAKSADEEPRRYVGCADLHAQERTQAVSRRPGARAASEPLRLG